MTKQKLYIKQNIIRNFEVAPQLCKSIKAEMVEEVVSTALVTNSILINCATQVANTVHLQSGSTRSFDARLSEAGTVVVAHEKSRVCPCESLAPLYFLELVDADKVKCLRWNQLESICRPENCCCLWPNTIKTNSFV